MFSCSEPRSYLPSGTFDPFAASKKLTIESVRSLDGCQSLVRGHDSGKKQKLIGRRGDILVEADEKPAIKYADIGKS